MLRKMLALTYVDVGVPGKNHLPDHGARVLGCDVLGE